MNSVLAIVATLLSCGLQAQVNVTTGDLDRLLSLYREYGLPFPPRDAPLVRDGSTGATSGAGVQYRAGYLLEMLPSGHDAVVQMGTAQVEINGSEFPELKPDAATAMRISISTISHTPFDHSSGLAFAAIEHSRGYTEFAAKMLDRVIAGSNYRRTTWQWPKEGSPIDVHVGFLALQHLLNESLDPGVERTDVIARLRQVFGLCRTTRTDESCDFLRKLELTVSYRYKGRDPIERLIDGLCDSIATVWNYGTMWQADEIHHKQILAIVDQGFDAVPALLRHLDDERLTRAVHRSMVSPTQLCTVGDVCMSLLADIAKGQVEGVWRGAPDSKEKLEEWWSEASTVTEREYCLNGLSASVSYTSNSLVRIAEKRHPSVLPTVIRTILEREAPFYVSPLFAAILRTEIPRQAIAELALLGVTNKDKDIAYSSLWALSESSTPDFDREMVRVLREMSDRPSGPAWLSREARHSQLAVQSDSDEVWKALTDTTKRANVDLRFELLKWSTYTKFTPERLRRWLVYAREFFDDVSSPPQDEPDPDGGPFMVRHHPFLPADTVQDLIALYVAYQLDITPIPSKGDPHSHWERLRLTVRERVDKILGDGGVGVVSGYSSWSQPSRRNSWNSQE